MGAGGDGMGWEGGVLSGRGLTLDFFDREGLGHWGCACWQLGIVRTDNSAMTMGTDGHARDFSLAVRHVVRPQNARTTKGAGMPTSAIDPPLFRHLSRERLMRQGARALQLSCTRGLQYARKVVPCLLCEQRQ